jgi:hypothetical protein
MIALDIETLAFSQTTVWAEFYAETAALATVVNNVHFTPWYGVQLRVKWQPPKSHNLSPLL